MTNEVTKISSELRQPFLGGDKISEGNELSNQNRSPKGNTWSAIPVALLCMIVIWSEGKQGSGPEGDEVL